MSSPSIPGLAGGTDGILRGALRRLDDDGAAGTRAEPQIGMAPARTLIHVTLGSRNKILLLINVPDLDKGIRAKYCCHCGIKCDVQSTAFHVCRIIRTNT
jgi:hypothetical protein